MDCFGGFQEFRFLSSTFLQNETCFASEGTVKCLPSCQNECHVLARRGGRTDFEDKVPGRTKTARQIDPERKSCDIPIYPDISQDIPIYSDIFPIYCDIFSIYSRYIPIYPRYLRLPICKKKSYYSSVLGR